MTAEDLHEYATKMRSLHEFGTDLGAAARFIDMIAPRRSRILDIGCGIGSTVGYLREHGHAAFGIDPTPKVLDVAMDLFGPEWFRLMRARELSTEALYSQKLPQRYEVMLMSGNTPAFLSGTELGATISAAQHLLTPGGALVVGTTAEARGGPRDQDSCAASTSLSLRHRYSDWHLGEFARGSSWSVSVFVAPGPKQTAEGPDGMFVLPVSP